MMKKTPLLIFVLLICTYTFISGTETQKISLESLLPEQFEAFDTPNDDGASIIVRWRKAQLTGELPRNIKYFVLQAPTPGSQFSPVAYVGLNENICSEKPKYFGFSPKNENFQYAEVSADKGKEFYYKLGVTDDETSITTTYYVGATARPNWFAFHKLNNFILMLMMLVFVILFYHLAQKNPNMFIRKIPGLEAIDEAVGRATEMGKPILYLTGYYDIGEISTISSVNILAHVAKKAAQYRSRIIVPNKWPVCMTVCQEVVRQAYVNAGRPEEYNPSDIFFIAGEQFSYTAAVDGLMMREKPAANFFLGTFAAEALLLAEAGATTGAIQISGTDSTYQIPFFVVACDYCLIGEELYAASVYLSREPRLLGTLKTVDSAKIVLASLLFIGTVLVTFNVFTKMDGVFLLIKHFFTVL